MHYKLQKANQITLNTLKPIISPESRQPDYLAMLFPQALRACDTAHQLDFIFDTEDTEQRNTRTTFANGNIIRYPEKEAYARANQSRLSLIEKYLRTPGAAADWEAHLAKQFPLLHAAALAEITETDAALYPEDFAALLRRTEQSGNAAALLLLLLLWAVFGERIPPAERFSRADAPVSAAVAEPPGRQEFCEKALREIPCIRTVDFAFHAGDFWLLDSERIDFLLGLIRSGVHLRVLVDQDAPTKLISSHMDHRERFTLPHGMIMQNWLEFERRNPEFVEVRFSPVPILRNYCCFEAEDPRKSAMRLVFYSYGQKMFRDYYALCPAPDTKHFAVFRDEFLYLWERGTKDMG